MLAAGTGGAEDLHLDILRADIHLHVVGISGMTSTRRRRSASGRWRQRGRPGPAGGRRVHS